jgi:transcriptional regulator with XRE-family HTH domain
MSLSVKQRKKRAAKAIGVQVGERIRHRRRACGKTQRDLAGAIGATTTQISRFESGIQSVDVSMLRLLAGALDCTTAHLLGE